MTRPLSICIEDVDHARYVRCAALPGGAPGLSITAEGEVRWRQPSSQGLSVWVTADDRLALVREDQATLILLTDAAGTPRIEVALVASSAEI